LPLLLLHSRLALRRRVTGLAFTVIYIAGFKVFGWENTSENWLFGISPEGIGTVGMMINFVISVTVCLLTPPPPQNVQEMVETIRTPR